MNRAVAILCLMVFSGAVFARIQPAGRALSRVLMIQSHYGRGSTFSVDVDNREYWITAKHVLTGAEHPPYGTVTSSVSLQMLDPGAEGEKWLPETLSVIDTRPDVDIVVLASSIPLLPNAGPSETPDSGGTPVGGECEFLGFPYGGAWRANFSQGSYWMPFVKHCTVSAGFPDEDKRMQTWILDGINNEGFSGGPVIFGTDENQKIMAVISGYRTDLAEVVPTLRELPAPETQSQPPQHSAARVNSGFIIAYDIHYATDAIKARPIGPLRTPK